MAKVFLSGDLLWNVRAEASAEQQIMWDAYGLERDKQWKLHVREQENHEN